MPYEIYKLVHLFGIFSVMIALAATIMHVLRGGTRADNPYRRGFGILHGVGIFLILLGGFGMLARIDTGFQGWVIAKLIIWLVVGAAMGLVYRGAGIARATLIALPLLGVLAAYFALYKPL